MMEIETSGWSGEGAFTQALLEGLKTLEQVAFVRVEDAPSTRSEADYHFISNEIFVTFQVSYRVEPARRFGFLPASRKVAEKAMTIPQLETTLAGIEGIGPADYADESMIQFLRAERIVPPYQTRGYKLVELVRIYEIGASR
jgi:hypothetical protein